MADRFGAVVSRHPVAVGTRRRNAAWALAAAVPTGWLGLWGLSTAGSSSGSAGGNKAIGVVTGLALVALYVAVTQTLRALRGGPGEYFEVRERGLVHGSRRGADGWTWDRVVSITIPSDPKPNAIAQRLGNDYRCTLALDDGTRLRIDGHATGPVELARAVLRNCPDAVRLAGDEWQRRASGWFLAGAAAFLATVIAIVTYIADHPDTTRRVTEANGSTSLQDVPGISDGMVMAFALGLAVCAVGALTCVLLFVRYRWYRRR